MTQTKSGFVAIIGPSNAGKSTLINQIMGRKVSAVSHKVQTTRTRLRAVKMVSGESSPPPAGGPTTPKQSEGGSRGGNNSDYFCPPPTRNKSASTPPQGGSLPTQIIFIDTPGIFRPARRLDRAMIAAALDSLSSADAVLLMVDATHGITKTTKEIITKLEGVKLPPCGGVAELSGEAASDAVGGNNSDFSRPPPAHKTVPPSLSRKGGSLTPILFAAINKVDAVPKPVLLPIAAELSETGLFKEIFMISGLKNDGITQMLKSLAAAMPESPYLFPPHDATDVPDALWLAEITREKVYKFVHQELPYQIYVATEKVETDPEGVLEIYQKIVVANENHKKIVVGKGGEMLQKIGTAARHEIQDEWGVNARLHLFVRVEKDWENRFENYEEQGLEFNK